MAESAPFLAEEPTATDAREAASEDPSYSLDDPRRGTALGLAHCRFALVVPARNEEATIVRVVDSFRTALVREGVQLVRVIVVDDRSTDGTARLAARAGAEVHSLLGEGGLARAFVVGTRAALDHGATHVLHVDGDGQYSAKDVTAILGEVARGVDLVVGNRLHRRPICMSGIRYRANRLFSAFIADMTGVPVDDCQSGYRAFTRDLILKCDVSGRHTYTQEQILRAIRLGYRLAWTPISFNERISGKSRLIRSSISYSLQVILHVGRVNKSLDGKSWRLALHAFRAACREFAPLPQEHHAENHDAT